jgi:hypothetical protein
MLAGKGLIWSLSEVKLRCMVSKTLKKKGGGITKD